MLMPVDHISKCKRNYLFYPRYCFWWRQHFEYLLGSNHCRKNCKPSVKIFISENILQKLQSGGHKVLIFSQNVCVIDFPEDLLRVKQSKHERLGGLKSTSHQASAVDRFCWKLYQRFVIILRTRALGLGLDLPLADTYVIFDNYWNPQLRTTLSPLYVQRR